METNAPNMNPSLDATIPLGEVLVKIKRLEDSDSNVRLTAAGALAQMGHEAALEILCAVLRGEGPGSDDYAVRLSAAWELKEIQDPRALEALCAALQDKEGELRQNVAFALEERKDLRSVPALCLALKDRYSFVGAARALGEIGDSRAVEPLCALLGEEDRVFRRLAAFALVRIGDVQAIQPLHGALRDPNRWLRESAAEVLGWIGDEQAVEPLSVALQDPIQNVRGAAAEALACIGNAQAVAVLDAALEHQTWEVRCAAARALWRRGDVRAVETLCAELQSANSSPQLAQEREDIIAEALQRIYYDPVMEATTYKALEKEDGLRAVQALCSIPLHQNLKVRVAVIRVLGRLGSRHTVEPLFAALQEEEEEVWEAAVEALVNVTDTGAVEPLCVALSSAKGVARAVVIDALGNFADVQAVAITCAALWDEDPWIRRTAARNACAVIRRLKFNQTAADNASAAVRAQEFERLCALLHDEDSEVRDFALRALEKTGDKRAVEPIQNALQDENEYVRRKAAEVLRTLKDSQTVGAYANIDDMRAPFDSVAVKWMVLMGGAQATEALCEMLQDKDPGVRLSAARMLADLTDLRGATAWHEAEEHAGATIGSPPIKIDPDTVKVVEETYDTLAVESLCAPIQYTESELRALAVRALEHLGGAILPLCAALQDENWEVRIFAAKALGKIGDSQAIQFLQTALGDNEPSVRWYAAEALAQIEDAASQ